MVLAWKSFEWCVLTDLQNGGLGKCFFEVALVFGFLGSR